MIGCSDSDDTGVSGNSSSGDCGNGRDGGCQSKSKDFIQGFGRVRKIISITRVQSQECTHFTHYNHR